MPILKNARHEKYAQARVSGKSIRDAYVMAGFKTNAGNASRLNEREDVKARIAEMVQEAASLIVVDRAWITQKLVENLLGALTEADRSPANRALELLGKDFGMFKERIELGGHIQVANTDLFRKMLPDERAAMRQMLLAAASRPVAANDDDEQAGLGVPMIGDK